MREKRPMKDRDPEKWERVAAELVAAYPTSRTALSAAAEPGELRERIYKIVCTHRNSTTPDYLTDLILREVQPVGWRDGWQPIETAPTDGSKVHIAIISKEGNIISDVGWFCEGETHEEWDEVDDGVMVKIWEEQDEGIWTTNYGLCELEEPTHWRPFEPPQPPSTEGGGEDG